MIINANTKIGAVLRRQPEALEAIVSISPKFSKLRNPILRRLIADRASIALASKMGGCRVDDFFSKLQPLGFEIEKKILTEEEVFEKVETMDPVPEFLKHINRDKIIALDVRPVIKEGKDPLTIILKKTKALKEDQALEIINSFEPSPLMHLLRKQGFESYAEQINEDLVLTYFFRTGTNQPEFSVEIKSDDEGWQEALQRFDGRMVNIDVRKLEMPGPMHAILEALDSIEDGKALFVNHKRIPLFLIPELQERNFDFRIKEVSENEVHLLIYRD